MNYQDVQLATDWLKKADAMDQVAADIMERKDLTLRQFCDLLPEGFKIGDTMVVNGHVHTGSRIVVDDIKPLLIRRGNHTIVRLVFSGKCVGQSGRGESWVSWIFTKDNILTGVRHGAV